MIRAGAERATRRTRKMNKRNDSNLYESSPTDLSELVRGARSASSANQFSKNFPDYYFIGMGFVDGQLRTESGQAKEDVESRTTEFLLPEHGSQHLGAGSKRAGEVFVLPARSSRRHTYTVGRALESDIILLDWSVSGVHAQISVSEKDGVSICDLSSKNGTKLNNQSMTSGLNISLNSSDLITFGRVSLQFFRPGALYAMCRILYGY